MLRTRAYLITAALSFFGFQSAWAQDPQSQNPQSQSPPPAQQPVQPQNPMPPSDQDNQSQGNQTSPNQAPVSPVVAGTVSNAPITGANKPPLGVLASSSFVSPAVEFFGQLDSNGTNTPFGGFAGVGSVLGMVDLQKTMRSAQTNLDAVVGRSFSNNVSVYNSTTTAFRASELWSRGRWDGFLSDSFSYSSQTSYLGGVSPIEVANLGDFAGVGGIGPIILRSSFLPQTGIFTNFGPRLSNALVAQVNNHLSRRTFFTLVGNYDTLRFFNSGLIDSSSAGIQAGFGYQRTREDSLAIVYRFNDLWFSGVGAGIRDNVIEPAYQRQIRERWNFEIGAGPDIAFIHVPNFAAGTGAQSNYTHATWTGDASINYELRRSALGVAYGRFVTNGGGVFLGSQLNGVSGTFSHDFSRLWKGVSSVNYSRNKNLVSFPISSAIAAPPGAVFDSVYWTFQLHRRIGRDSDLFFGYIGRYQTSSYFYCTNSAGTSGVCLGPNTSGEMFNFGFVWRVKPVPIG